MRTFVIGDIHGAHKALVQCLERSGLDRKRDTLITLGDICDGWHEVRQCVDELLTIDNRIDIMGNHDDWFRTWLKSCIHPDAWTQGGHATWDSYLPEGAKWMLPEDISGPHWKFFIHQRLYYWDEERNYFFVHAGFNRLKSIDENREDAPSEFYWDRELWNAALVCQDGEKLRTAEDFDTIFIGHTSTNMWKTKELQTSGGIIIPKGSPIMTPMFAGGVWNLDTGAGWKGKLTIMDVDSKEYWQSDRVTDLYPGEAARKFLKL